MSETYITGQKAISEYLGCSMSTLKRWIRTNGLPVYKLGSSRQGRLVANTGVLDRWVRRHSQLNADQLNGTAEEELSSPQSHERKSSRPTPNPATGVAP